MASQAQEPLPALAGARVKVGKAGGFPGTPPTAACVAAGCLANDNSICH